MSLLVGIALVVAGALLTWRVDGSLAGLDGATFGVILIAIGVVGVLVSQFSGSGPGATRERAVEEERPRLRR